MSVSVAHHFGGGVYAKAVTIPAGLRLEQHIHLHDHLSILAQGIADVEVDGKLLTFIGPVCLTIAAGKTHTVISRTDIVWFCVHATSETDINQIDSKLIYA